MRRHTTLWTTSALGESGACRGHCGRRRDACPEQLVAGECLDDEVHDRPEATNIVYGTVEVTGTHTSALSIPHGKTLTATGRRLQNPLERVAITVSDGKVTEWAVEQVRGGGISGILGQLS